MRLWSWWGRVVDRLLRPARLSMGRALDREEVHLQWQALGFDASERTRLEAVADDIAGECRISHLEAMRTVTRQACLGLPAPGRDEIPAPSTPALQRAHARRAGYELVVAPLLRLVSWLARRLERAR